MDLGFVCGQEHDVNPAPLICLCGNPSPAELSWPYPLIMQGPLQTMPPYQPDGSATETMGHGKK